MMLEPPLSYSSSEDEEDDMFHDAIEAMAAAVGSGTEESGEQQLAAAMAAQQRRRLTRFVDGYVVMIQSQCFQSSHIDSGTFARRHASSSIV
jgi:hypothetical protein